MSTCLTPFGSGSSGTLTLSSFASRDHRRHPARGFQAEVESGIRVGAHSFTRRARRPQDSREFRRSVGLARQPLQKHGWHVEGYRVRAHARLAFPRHLWRLSIRGHRVRPQCPGHERRRHRREQFRLEEHRHLSGACAVPNRTKGAPKLSGIVPEIRIRPGSYLETFYGENVIKEEFFCNFELNPEYEWCSIEAGFPIAARGPEGEVRAIESPTHRFFIATLFQPQLSSTAKKPHPLVVAFVQAAADWGRKNSTTACWSRSRARRPAGWLIWRARVARTLLSANSQCNHPR